MFRRVTLTHSSRSDAILEELRKAAGTFAAAVRLLALLAADPGRQGQRLIRSRPGWVWACERCKREIYGDAEAVPSRCPACRYPRLLGREETVHYLIHPVRGGPGYDGGLSLMDFYTDFGRWICAVTTDPRGLRVVEAHALGHGEREAANYAACSPRYARMVLRAIREGYDHRRDEARYDIAKARILRDLREMGIG